MLGKNARLGLTKRDLIRRVDKATESVSPASAPLTFVRSIHKQIAGLLWELGVPLPFWLMLPNPLRNVFSRQNVITLQPRGQDGSTQNFSFQARNKGFLVLNDIEIAPQDALAFDQLEIEFRMTNRKNSVDYSRDPGREPGTFWKFSKWVGFDQDILDVTIRNLDEFGVIVTAVEFSGWEV